MSVRVRFAPSPTGGLHIGGVRTALYNYLFARKHNGTFILRIEDTDQTRFVEGAEEYILNSLAWCGITFDEGVFNGGPHAPYRQSERKDIYRIYAQKLIETGAAYYAFDTPEDLDEMRTRLEASGVKSPQYNSVTRMAMKNSITMSGSEVEEKIASGFPHVIRLKVPRKEEIRFYDEVRGWVSINSSQVDDKVLMKSDGMPTYHMANVVDDFLMQITHVIRGEEWLSSTPLHVLLYRAFGWEEQRPKFAHLPLILKPEGTGKLSKRDGDKFPQFPLEWTDAEGKTFKGFRELGYLPEALINFLALLGWNPGHDEEVMDINRLIEAFSIERIGKSGTKFDLQKATWFNEVYLRNKPDTELLHGFIENLKKAGIFNFQEEYLIKVISLLKDRISFENELVSFGKYFFITPEEYDPEMVAKHWNPDHKGWLKQYHDVLDQVSDWNTEEIENTLKKLAETLGMKSGKMMPVLRLVFTGVSFGPAAIQIAETIGKPETLKRITQALNRLP